VVASCVTRLVCHSRLCGFANHVEGRGAVLPGVRFAKGVADPQVAFPDLALRVLSPSLPTRTARSPELMEQRYIVRYGLSRHVAEFGTRGREEYTRGTQVVVRSDRGHEVGEVLCPATDRTREFLGAGQKGSILREVSDTDRTKLDQLTARAPEEFRQARELLQRHGLAVQLLDVEHLLGDDRLVLHYVSEARIDFREVVKTLAGHFGIRIEMRQVGLRDEAKLLADYGDCGKPVCCNTHLREMPPVSMKMAKLQKASLDPAKLSGRCGRLKCCLRYEYDTYEEHRRELPGVGAVVVTRRGQGRVVGQELLAKRVLVQYEDNRQMLTDFADVVTVVSKGRSAGGETDREERDA